MKLVTRLEAAKLSPVKLYSLRKEAFIAFTAAPRDSEAQRAQRPSRCARAKKNWQRERQFFAN